MDLSHARSQSKHADQFAGVSNPTVPQLRGLYRCLYESIKTINENRRQQDKPIVPENDAEGQTLLSDIKQELKFKNELDEKQQENGIKIGREVNEELETALDSYKIGENYTIFSDETIQSLIEYRNSLM